MDIKEQMDAFDKRWDIEYSESPEESFGKFKARILNIFEDIDIHLPDYAILEFCKIRGIRKKTYANILNCFENENTEKEFYRLIQIIFLLNIPYEFYADYFRDDDGHMEPDFDTIDTQYTKKYFYKEVSDAIKFSNINISISSNEEGVILYPTGEKELDEVLVNQTLSFLDSESDKHFKDALQFYQDKNHIESAESLRRSLEEFLRYKLQNSKGLASNIEELGQQLKESGRDAQIRNITFQTFNYLDTYFNENSKHNDGDIDEPENEYLIYQTGVLMRYIHRSIQNEG